MPVRVQVHIRAPIDRVFEAVSGHERFLRTADGTATMVLREGASERSGLGCVREARVGSRVRYLEDITAWERPSGFAYTIRESTLPLRHRGSSLAFTELDGGTEAWWTASFEIPVPMLGRFLRPWLDRRLDGAFTVMLRATKERIEATAASAPQSTAAEHP